MKGWDAFRPGERIDLDNIEDLKALLEHRRQHHKQILENANKMAQKKGDTKTGPKPES